MRNYARHVRAAILSFEFIQFGFLRDHVRNKEGMLRAACGEQARANIDYVPSSYCFLFGKLLPFYFKKQQKLTRGVVQT